MKGEKLEKDLGKSC